MLALFELEAGAVLRKCQDSPRRCFGSRPQAHNLTTTFAFAFRQNLNFDVAQLHVRFETSQISEHSWNSRQSERKHRAAMRS